MFQVNVLDNFSVTRNFLPQLRESAELGKPAHIITTGSENSISLPGFGVVSTYTATKHALLGLIGRAATRPQGHADQGFAALPGVVSTDLLDSRRSRPEIYGGPQYVTAEQRDRAETVTASLGKTPEETARLCFLGIARGDFLIVTDQKIREFAERGHREVHPSGRQSDLSEQYHVQRTACDAGAITPESPR